MGKSLMVMGTASSVGKSVITTGLCRLFYNRGYNVSPFKSQNMALNSYITKDGKEMGRAQVVQAEAACKEPDVRMNPILIKPSSDVDSQIIFKGEIMDKLNAEQYHNFKPKLIEEIGKIYKSLEDDSELVILEGAGSPAEINLREGDLVNMGMAEISDSPVILVGDIDKGGVFASLYGTIKLLAPEEQARIKGVIINKFRGDVKLLEPGLKMLEDLIDIPVLGVIPWNDIDIEDEDSVSLRFKKQQSKGVIDISVLRYPHISNYTDFAILEAIKDVNIRYVHPGEPIGETDVIILPGSKSVMSDFRVLKECGWDQEIYRCNNRGITIVGICGGYQMLGRVIEDPYGVEGDVTSINGLGLLNSKTVFNQEKQTLQSRGRICISEGEWSDLHGLEVEGYEIHMGETTTSEEYLIDIDGRKEGIVRGNIWGTYFHGIFDNKEFTEVLIRKIKRDLGITGDTEVMDYKTYKNTEYNRLADLYEECLDIEKIEDIIKTW